MLVSGQPGSRIDFVAGWLGMLPNYFNNNWVIDPATGQSNGNMRFTKQLSSNCSLHTKLKELDVTIDSHSSITRAGAWHPCAISGMEDYIGHGISICHIVPDKESLPKIFWENKVKTLVSGNDIDHVIRFYEQIDPATIDNKFRQQYFKKQLQSNYIQIDPEPEYQHVNLEYRKLFVNGGSYYLCKQLNLTADQSCHDYWNKMLPMADSPLEIMAWGQLWRKQDWPINSCAVLPELHS